MLKKIMAGLICLLLGANLFAASTATLPATGNLVVNFVGLNNNKGVVRVALFNSASSYQNSNDQGDGAFAKAAASIANNSAIWVFKNIPFGVYAIKAYHDENLTNSMSRNFFGMPTVDYGFSNNPASFGIPTFAEAQFNFNTTEQSLVIEMQH